MNISNVASFQLLHSVMYIIYNIFAIHHYYSTVLNNTYMYKTLYKNEVKCMCINDG